MTSISNLKGSTVLSSTTQTYDNNGNIETVTQNRLGEATTTNVYTYDKLNRIATITRPNGKTINYTYDTEGNRKTVNEAFNLENIAYEYDLYNKLTSVTKGGQTTAFEYSPDGLRYKKTVDAVVKQYRYNQNREVIAEVNANNQTTAHYVRGDRLLVKKDAATSKDYYYLYNSHGDVIQIVDTSGVIKNSYKYDEWGNIVEEAELVDNAFKYAGEIYDKETGLYYLRARYYNPSIGRFINEDTYEGQINNPLTLNLYTYVSNNPLIYIDPSGNYCISVDGKYAHSGECNDTKNSDNYMSDKLLDGMPFIDKGIFMGIYNAKGEIDYLAFNDFTKQTFWDYMSKKSYDKLKMSIPLNDVELMFANPTNLLGRQSIRTTYNCFTVGTKVHTDEGEKNIEDIEVGDMVLSKNEEPGEQDYKEVTALHRNEKDTTYKLSVGNQIIETTDNHPFWVDSKGWVLAVDLTVGDKLVQSNGNHLKIDNIEIVHHDEKVKVYNFTVADFHTYFVSSLGIWVHNIQCGPSSSTTVNALAEVKSPNPIKASKVIDRWDDYLGPGTHTNIHPITGQVDPNRIWSADGKRAIRFGNHEMNSIGTNKGHYHEETWTYDPHTDTMTVTNTLVRIQK